MTLGEHLLVVIQYRRQRFKRWQREKRCAFFKHVWKDRHECARCFEPRINR